MPPDVAVIRFQSDALPGFRAFRDFKCPFRRLVLALDIIYREYALQYFQIAHRTHRFVVTGSDITVDAYLSAIEFYKKNDFKVLSEKVVNEHTKLMFFDMMELG